MKNEENLVITYYSTVGRMVLTYAEDLESYEFLSIGFDASDALLLAAHDAGGHDFDLDAILWEASVS